MPIEHVNRKGKTFYLHQGTTKTGKPKYYFSTRSDGTLIDFIPDGFEVYENPQAQVFLRRIRPKIISDDEIAIVEDGMKRFSSEKYYRIDVRKNVIIVYTAGQDVDLLSELFVQFPMAKQKRPEINLEQMITYSPDLQFVLIDQDKRTFITQRYCFLGSIDDWIEIGKADKLATLVETYVKHLGQDSYFELY